MEVAKYLFIKWELNDYRENLEQNNYRFTRTGVTEHGTGEQSLVHNEPTVLTAPQKEVLIVSDN
jgi:hypothetical protein